jgi:hypothetical protein
LNLSNDIPFTNYPHDPREKRSVAQRKILCGFLRLNIPRFKIHTLSPNHQLGLVQDALAESKIVHFSPFFTFFQLRSTGYAPSKTQKLKKNQPVFANGRES